MVHSVQGALIICLDNLCLVYREPRLCSNCLLCAYCKVGASRLDSSSVPPLRSLVSWAGVLRPHASRVLRTWVVRGSLLAFAVGVAPEEQASMRGTS